MRALSSLVLLLLVALALAAAEGCATAQSVTRTHGAHHAKHRTKLTAHAANGANGANGATGANGALASADGADADDDDDDDSAGGGRGEDGEQDLTALSVSEGGASYYHDSLAGRVTANGEKYDPESATCAHRSLPFGTVLVIENVATGKKSHCRVNDRGPYVDGRLLDVSRHVARDLGMLDRGVIRVRIRVAKSPTAS